FAYLLATCTPIRLSRSMRRAGSALVMAFSVFSDSSTRTQSSCWMSSASITPGQSRATAFAAFVMSLFNSMVFMFSPSPLIKCSDVVGHTVDGKLLAADENRSGLHVSAFDVNDAESLLPVRGTALEVLGLFHIHQVSDLHAGQDPGLARVANRVAGDAQTVGVPHDDARVQLLRCVTGRPTCNRVQPDTTTVSVGSDPARSNLVEFRQLPNFVVVELKQLIHVESMRLGQCRGVLAQVDPRTFIVVALVEPDLTSVHLAEGLNQVPDRVLGVLEHRALELSPCSLGPSRWLRVVDHIANVNHFVRLVFADEFNDRLYSP